MLHMYTWLPNMVVFHPGGHSYATYVHLVTQYYGVPAWWSQFFTYVHLVTQYDGVPTWWSVMLHMYTWLPNMMVFQHCGRSVPVADGAGNSCGHHLRPDS